MLGLIEGVHLHVYMNSVVGVLAKTENEIIVMKSYKGPCTQDMLQYHLFKLTLYPPVTIITFHKCIIYLYWWFSLIASLPAALAVDSSFASLCMLGSKVKYT